MPLTEQLRAASVAMQQDFNRRTSGLGQNLDRGEAREAVVRDFLKTWLPRKYQVGRGEIITSNGDRSRQMDVVVYDDFSSPVIFRQEDSPQVYPIESVYGVTEVKSHLTPAELDSALRNIASSAALPRQEIQVNFGGVAVRGDYRPFTSIFAFEGPVDPDPLLRAWAEDALRRGPTTAPSIACILGKGCLMYGSRETGWSMVPHPGANPIWVNAGDDALLLYFLAISTWMADAVFLPVPNLLAYAGGSLTYDVRSFEPS